MEASRTRFSTVIPLNRYLAFFAIAALLLSLVELTEMVQLPFENALSGGVSRSLVSSGTIISLISSQGYLSLFVLMTLESASLPIPSEIVLPYAGYLVYLGQMNFALALAVSTFALMLGAFIDYFLALKLGRPVFDGLLRLVGVKPQSIDRAERWMNTKGYWSILVARFIPGIRSSISIPAGLFEVDISHFFTMTLVGSVGWSAVLIYIGYSEGQYWGQALGASSGTIIKVALITLAAVSASYLGYFLIVTKGREPVEAAFGQKP